ncbi:MAG: hypothetical protein ACE5EN_07975 [Nitrospinota bacterium]
MSAELLYGLLFMVLSVIIIVAGALYVWFTREKQAPKKRPKRPPTLTPQRENQETAGTYVPPEVPRTVGTIKQIARSEPELVESVLRGWIKGGVAANIKLKPEYEKKKRRK